MGKKIAIIATDFLEQFIKDMITELDMGFQYHIFTYEKFEDIKDIYKKIGPESKSAALPVVCLQVEIWNILMRSLCIVH